MFTVVILFLSSSKEEIHPELIKFSQTLGIGIGSLALARAALEEALLVLGEGAAVEGPVPVGDLLPGLLLAELWARGTAFLPR